MADESSLVARLKEHGQDHLLRWVDELDPAARHRLVAEVDALDLPLVDRLFRDLGQGDAAAITGAVTPLPVERLPRTDGERVARRHVAVVDHQLLAFFYSILSISVADDRVHG